jgi:hypothetical protein
VYGCGCECGCVDVWVCGCVGVWVCGFVCVCVCVCVWVGGWVGGCVCGCVGVWGGVGVWVCVGVGVCCVCVGVVGVCKYIYCNSDDLDLKSFVFPACFANSTILSRLFATLFKMY